MKPTRMEAAKSVARDFVQRQPASVQIGIVAFSDSGFSVLEPTNDQETILAAINRLKPERGTSLANGIFVSLNTIATQLGQPSVLSNGEPAPGLPPDPEGRPSLPPGTFSPAVILLLTDGENTVSPDPLEAAQTAVDRGVRVHTIGVGSPAGTILEINDFTVHTQLDEAMLKGISQITSGTYYNAVSEQDLRTIYESIDLKLVVKEDHLLLRSRSVYGDRPGKFGA